MAKSEPPRSVLIIRLSALGDVAIALPVIYSVCRAHPSTRFVLLTQPVAAQIFIDPPANLTVPVIDVKRDHSGPAALWRLARQLRRQHGIDAVADLHSVMRSWVIDASLAACGCRVSRIDKGHAQKRALTRGKLRRQLPTSGERYRQVFNRLGLEAADTFQPFTGIGSAIIPAKPACERWIAVAPFSQHRGKVYPLPLMRQVVTALAALPHATVWLMGGGKNEREQLARWEQQIPHTISMAGKKHSFADEFALFCQCDCMVSMDSANMHLASLCGLPVVSVWGATHPWCGFMGWHQSMDNAVQLPLPCRPCSVFGQKPCRWGDYRCLTGIEPQTIVQHVQRLLP